MPRPEKRETVFSQPQASPGRLYKSISVERPVFSSGETKLEKPALPKFVSFCRWCGKNFPAFGGKQPFAPKYKDAVDFLGWDLKPNEFNAAIAFSLLVTLIAGLAIASLLWIVPLIQDCTGPIDAVTKQPTCTAKTIVSVVGAVLKNETMAMAYLFLPLAMLVYFIFNYVQRFPLNAAHDEQIKALTYVPEIVGYLTMSMKLVPNLEKAVEFAAQHGRGKIAEDFRKMIWDVQLGVYNTLSEALDALAYRWGKFSDEFKRSLMMVRASVLEDSESKRYALLDKTMTELLESIRNKMEDYARSLTQPSTFLFYLGVLMPLILVIILPIGSAFSRQPLARADILFVLYNIIIPLGAWLFARSVIQKRPPTYESPIIPDSHPDLPKKWKMLVGKSQLDIRMVIIVLLVAGIGVSFYLSQYGLYLDKDTALIPHDRTLKQVIKENFNEESETYFDPGGTLYNQLFLETGTEEEALLRLAVEKQKFFARPENDITPYLLIFGTMFTIAGAIAIGLYYRNIYKRRMQENIATMESEFKDSLYIMASRMGENKPVEEALQHTRNFLSNTLIADRIYGKTVDNINILGLPLESAIFDPNFGSMKNLNSNIIRSSMKLLVDSVQLGVNVGARTLISLSLQLSNAEKVSRLMSTLTEEITSVMQTTAIFIAPVILGVTTSLQKIVIQTVLQVSQDVSSNAPISFSTINTPGFKFVDPSKLSTFDLQKILGSPGEIAGNLASPGVFIAIIAIYVIEIVIIMTYFNTKIKEDNDVLFKINLAKALPVAVLVFIISVIASNSIVGMVGGGG